MFCFLYVCKHKHLWGTFSTNGKKKLKSIERKSKNEYIYKFNWIHNTQLDQILKSKLINLKEQKIPETEKDTNDESCSKLLKRKLMIT